MNDGRGSRRVVALLKGRDLGLWVKIAVMVVLGPPLTLIGPALLASIFWFATWRLSRTYVPWTWFFAGLTLVMVPLLIRLEVRTAGDYLSEALQDGGPRIQGWALLPGPYWGIGGLAATMANPRGVSAGLVEVFLVGPRLLVSAFRQARLRRRLGKMDVQRAAEIIEVLAAHEHGLPPSALQYRSEKPDDLLPVLNWLLFHRWIGISAGGERVYLYSESRAALGTPFQA